MLKRTKSYKCVITGSRIIDENDAIHSEIGLIHKSAKDIYDKAVGTLYDGTNIAEKKRRKRIRNAIKMLISEDIRSKQPHNEAEKAACTHDKA